MPFTRVNLRDDVADVGSNFDGPSDLEFRVARNALELEESGLTFQRIPPSYRFPFGHTHREQEEVFVVVGGSGRMKLDEEIIDVTRIYARPEPEVQAVALSVARVMGEIPVERTALSDPSGVLGAAALAWDLEK